MKLHFSIIRIGCTLLYGSCLVNCVVALGIIAAWNISGRESNYDALAVSLTVLEILLAMIAAGGFWIN
jgi:hypothetical protein